jgi:hypothetical protein
LCASRQAREYAWDANRMAMEASGYVEIVERALDEEKDLYQDPLNNFVANFTGDDNELLGVLSAIAHGGDCIMTREQFCRIAKIGSTQERYSALYSLLNDMEEDTLQYRLLYQMVGMCEQDPELYEKVLKNAVRGTSPVLYGDRLREYATPIGMSRHSVGKRVNAIAQSLAGTGRMEVTADHRDFMREFTGNRALRRFLFVGKCGVVNFLGLTEIYMLSTVCVYSNEAFTSYQAGKFMPSNARLSVNLRLVKGSAPFMYVDGGDLVVSKMNTDLFDNAPLLSSNYSKTISITRINMTRDTDLAETLQVLLGGFNHTLMIHGFSAENLLSFLKGITFDGAYGPRVAKLELHIKGQSAQNAISTPTSMNRLCAFVAGAFTQLTHLSIIKTPFKTVDRVYLSRQRNVTKAYEAVEQGMPWLHPVCDGLKHLWLDYPELDTDEFISQFMRFRHLQTLTLKRLSPVFSRRHQVIKSLLQANCSTLRSVDFDLGAARYGFPDGVCSGVHELVVNHSVMNGGLTVRVLDNVDLVQVRVVDYNGTVDRSAHVLATGDGFLHIV